MTTQNTERRFKEYTRKEINLIKKFLNDYDLGWHEDVYTIAKVDDLKEKQE